MKFLKYWALGECHAEVPGHGPVHIRKWVGSDQSQEDAKRKAETVMKDLALRVSKKTLKELQYGYGEEGMREELLEEKRAEGDTVFALSRNRYGAVVLNAPSVLFADIDGTSRRGLVDSLKFLVGLKPARRKARTWRESALMEEVESFFKSHPQASGRLYFTANGMRLMLTHDRFSPEDSRTSELLERFHSDPLYVKLCRRQKCFRARLTAKPWRVHLGLPPSFPRDDEEQKEFEGWLKDYEKESESVATCQFVEKYGSSLLGSQIAELVDIHDKWTKANSGLRLA